MFLQFVWLDKRLNGQISHPIREAVLKRLLGSATRHDGNSFELFRAPIHLRAFTLIKEKCGDDDQLHLGRNVDFATLPPCRGVLQKHIRRVNYQVAIWRRAHIAVADVPSPTGGHGWTLNSGHLEPLWFDGPILPEVLVQVEGFDSGDSDDEHSDDQESPIVSDDSEDSDYWTDIMYLYHISVSYSKLDLIT